MADNKKYYYLKLKDNFYDSEEMIILQNMQDGYLYSDILLKLYLRSLKNEGKLMFKDVIPYTPEVLAQVVRHQVGTVEKAIDIFQKLGLIEILDNGAIYLTDIQNFIGQSSTEADRKRNYRAKIQQEGQMSRQMSLKCPDKSTPEIEIEIEKEIDIDIDIEKKIEKTNIVDIKDKKKTKHKYGEYKNVLLTDSEYQKLEEHYGSSSLTTIITYLDEYLEMKGNKYKSHYMVIKKWGAEAALKQQREKSISFFREYLES